MHDSEGYRADQHHQGQLAYLAHRTLRARSDPDHSITGLVSSISAREPQQQVQRWDRFWNFYQRRSDVGRTPRGAEAEQNKQQLELKALPKDASMAVHAAAFNVGRSLEDLQVAHRTAVEIRGATAIGHAIRFSLGHLPHGCAIFQQSR
jgi:hypothetical protein